MKLAPVVQRFGGGSVLLVLGAIALLVVALALPRWSLPRDTFQYIIVFDITQSMDVEDYQLRGEPVSRLTYAREAVKRALGELPCGSRVGWGAFTEYRSLLLLSPVEVCENYNDLLASLDRIDGRMRWANASEVGKGVYWAVRTAKDAEPRPDVIFISDGHEAPPMLPGTPPTLPDDVQPGEVRGWIVGAGGATPQPIPRTDADGHRRGYWFAHDVIQLVSEDGTEIVGAEHLSALHEPHLKALAERVGFGYTHLESLDSIGAAMRDVRFVRREKAPTDLSWIPVSAALLLLVLRFRPDGVRPGRVLRRRG